DGAAVLDGGWQKGTREGRPVETGPAKPRPPGHFVVREQRPLMVGKEEVQQAIGNVGACTINALLPEQHAGTGGNSYGRPGHIKGSVNLPAAHLLDPNTNEFLPASELLEAVSLFGEPFPQHNSRFALPECPLVHYISNQDFYPDGRRYIPGEGYHTDHSNAARPPKATVLHAVSLPDLGGDTQYADMRL